MEKEEATGKGVVSGWWAGCGEGLLRMRASWWRSGWGGMGVGGGS